MNHAEGEKLIPALAREVCAHTNSRAVVQGTISDAGNNYSVELRAENCQTGRMLVRTKLEVNDRNRIVKMLGVAGNQLRQELGEPKSSLQKFNQPLDMAMSSSLEALQALAQGDRARNERGSSAALQFYQHAVELDPNFAYGYCYLAAVYGTIFEATSAAQNMDRAYELRDRATQRQKFRIESFYQTYITGDIEKALQVLLEMVQSYPRDSGIYNSLSLVLNELGKYREAYAEAREAVRLDNGSISLSNLMTTSIAMNRLDEAKTVYDTARLQKMEEPSLSINRYLVAFLEADWATMAAQLKWALGKPGAEDQMLNQQSDTEAYYGRFRTARELSHRAVELASGAGTPEAAARWRADEALREAMIGEVDRAREKTREGLQLSRSTAVTPFFGLALALVGDVTQATSIDERLNQERPQGTMIQNSWLPSIRAALDLQKNNPSNAIETLKRSARYETGNGSGCLSPVYVRGLAYLQAGEGQQAALEFQKVTSHPELVTNCLVGAVSRLQLARAQAMMGDKDAARKSYQDFLTLWKDADSDIPIYRHAKAEYAKLQ
jgi:tetratricopeptide (TPR) repeat protein